VFRVGHYLASTVETVHSPLRVDLEYNRMTRDQHDRLIKRLIIDGVTRKVYPDLIIHVRGTDSHNELALEAKVSPSAADRDKDLAKLRAFCDLLGYKYGIYLEFRGEHQPPAWQWVEGTESDHCSPALQPMWTP
jgi:hypothetical protein